MLEEAWTGGSRGHMSAVAEARAWALREVWREQHQGKGDYGLLSFVAARVKKVGGGNPSPSAVSQFFEKVDEDEGWFPGKRSEAAYGPKPVLHGAKRRRVAQKAMDMKESGVEPTYSRMVTDCGEDVINPKTGRPLDKKQIYNVFKTECKDAGSENYWKHLPRLSKTALTAKMRQRRFRFASHVLTTQHYGSFITLSGLTYATRFCHAPKRRPTNKRLPERDLMDGSVVAVNSSLPISEVTRVI